MIAGNHAGTEPALAREQVSRFPARCRLRDTLAAAQHSCVRLGTKHMVSPRFEEGKAARQLQEYRDSEDTRLANSNSTAQSDPIDVTDAGSLIWSR